MRELEETLDNIGVRYEERSDGTYVFPDQKIAVSTHKAKTADFFRGIKTITVVSKDQQMREILNLFINDFTTDGRLIRTTK